MNIFKILASHDGHIGETNISSFLGYLLDATEDHGLSASLLTSIVEDFHNVNSKCFARHYNGLGLLKRSFSIVSYSVQQETRVYPNDSETGNKGCRDIDIVIEFYDNDESKNVEYVICLENKINDNAISAKQLTEEYIGLKDKYENQNLNPSIYFCFLTPKLSTASDKAFKHFTDTFKGVPAIHLHWQGENSIQEKLKKIIKQENFGEIDPIPEDSLFLIKSFLSFISSNFSSHIDEKEYKSEYKKYGKSILDYVNDIVLSLKEDKDYKLDEIREELAKRVLSLSKHEIDKTTLYCNTKMVIVNEKTRVNWGCYKDNANRKDLLYYPDINNKNIVRVYNPDKVKKIDRFYKDK